MIVYGLVLITLQLRLVFLEIFLRKAIGMYVFVCLPISKPSGHTTQLIPLARSSEKVLVKINQPMRVYCGCFYCHNE